MYNYETIKELNEGIKEEISIFPYSHSYVSTLGGEVRASILITIGLDKPSTWSNGIFENSRYVRFNIENTRNGLVWECFTNNLNYCKFRKDNTIPEIKFRKFTGTKEKLMIRFKKDIGLLVDRMG